MCAVGCFSVLPCPALLVVCANLPTFRLVGFSTCQLFDLLGSWRVGELSIWRAQARKRWLQGAGGLAAIRGSAGWVAEARR